MLQERLNSPFDIQLQCFNHLSEINSLINILGESDEPALTELESIGNAMHHMLLRIDCYMSMQINTLKISHQMPHGYCGGKGKGKKQ